MEKKLIELYRGLRDDGVYLFERGIHFSNENVKSAVISMGGDAAIYLDTSKIDTLAEETEIIAHEYGHIATGAVHPVCSPFDIVEKHERRADKWAIQRLLPKSELENAVRAGYTEPWEIAEYLGRTEAFTRKAIAYYKSQEEPPSGWTPESGWAE